MNKEQGPSGFIPESREVTNNERINGVSLRGSELARLFIPEDHHTTISRDELEVVATHTRKYLARKLPGSVTNTGGVFHVTEAAYQLLERTGGIITDIISASSEIRLPDTNPERIALATYCVDSALENNGDMSIVAPVCPDYGKDDQFYRFMGQRISPEADAAIRAARVLSPILLERGFRPEFVILVADTETDKPEIIKNCAHGDSDFYRAQCQASASAVREKVAQIPGVSVFTFEEFLGSAFHDYQCAYEEKIRQLMVRDEKFFLEIRKIAEERVSRHTQILGRSEKDYELTLRYMAQYAALGSLLRESADPMMVMNYQTPNRRFFNAAMNKHKELVLSERDALAIPVLGTMAHR